MSHTIELPEPLFQEITGYAVRVTASPESVIRQAWDEFRSRHLEKKGEDNPQTNQETLLATVRSLHGSLTLPQGSDDDTQITEARMRKYGPI